MRFVDPPPKAEPRYDWAGIAKKCRRKPNEWLKVFEQDRQSLFVAIRQGAISALTPEQGFEVTTRNNKRPEDGPRTCDLYVRYVPGLDQEGS
jgi:hypothetical protein